MQPELPGDQCKCKMKCFAKVKDYDFISIPKGFYFFKDKDSLDTFLQGPIERYDFHKRREFKKGLIQILTLKLKPIAHLKDKTLTSTMYFVIAKAFLYAEMLSFLFNEQLQK